MSSFPELSSLLSLSTVFLGVIAAGLLALLFLARRFRLRQERRDIGEMRVLLLSLAERMSHLLAFGEQYLNNPQYVDEGFYSLAPVDMGNVCTDLGLSSFPALAGGRDGLALTLNTLSALQAYAAFQGYARARNQLCEEVAQSLQRSFVRPESGLEFGRIRQATATLHSLHETALGRLASCFEDLKCEAHGQYPSAGFECMALERLPAQGSASLLAKAA